jgi:fatty acid desaturase
VADLVKLGDIGYKRRNPWGVVLLSLITLGVYQAVWWYKINNEMRHYGIDNSPAKATWAVTAGVLVIVPFFISRYNTADRILQAQTKSGTEERISPVLALVISAVSAIGFFAPAYYQSQLNKVWDAEVAKGAQVVPKGAQVVPA